VLLGLAALPLGACGATTPSAATGQGAPAAAAAIERAPSPARYFLTASHGAIFDEATRGAAVPRRELAIVQGRRAALDGGAVASVARSPSGLVGFRSLPARLGGGYLIWSDVRTYHADDFLGALTPIAEVGPTAGTRAWFGSILLRSDRGFFSLDPKARALTRWKPQPGLVDALAIDDKRGVTLDIVGRVRATTDGGAAWTDVTAAHGYFANAARVGKKGEIELLSLTGSSELRLMPGGAAVEPTPPLPPPFARRHAGYGPYPYQYVNPGPLPEADSVDPVSQQLSPDALAWAAGAGVLLSGDRAVVGRDGGGVSVLSLKSGGELNSASLLGVDPQYANCQPIKAGSPRAASGSSSPAASGSSSPAASGSSSPAASGTSILLACAHAQGAEVLVFDGPVAAPKLEATFPEAGAFVTDDRGHVAFTGRCGRTPPSADDFGERVAQRRPYEEEDPYGGGYGPYGGGYDPDSYDPPVEPPENEKPPTDDKRVCVRLEGGDWIEHRLAGDDAKDLYRWVLGDDGAVTALLLKGANPEEDEEEKKKEEEEDDGPLRRPGGAMQKPRGDLLASPTAQPKAGPPPAKASPTAQPKAGAPPAPKKPAPSTAKPKPDPKAKPPAPKAEKPAAPKAKPEPQRAGVRTVRLDPEDRGLKHGKWPRLAPPQQQAPWRAADPNFWLEEDGSIRGWIRLPEEDGPSERSSESDGGDEHVSPIAEELSGRFAGVRVSPKGKATVLSLPARVKSVLFGGRFGFARAEDDDGERIQYFETTDGGATWTEVVGPPIGDVEDAYDDSRWPACSELGCALATGLVRVGWGSPKPPAPKKEKDTSAPAGADPFPVPRLPKLECRFEGEPEVFPLPPPKPKADPKPPQKPPAEGPDTPPGPDAMSQLPPDVQEMIRQLQQGGGAIPPGLLPPGLVPPAASASSIATAGPKAGKPPAPAKASAAAKPPPPPPADIVSLRTKPGSPLGQLKDKSWVVDFVVPFDPAAALKHATASANGLEKVTGSVVPVLGDRGIDLLLAWDRRRTLLGGSAAALLPFEYSGKLSSAVTVAGLGSAGPKGAAGSPAIVAFDEDRRVVVLVQEGASRAVLRTAKIPDPTRGRIVIARRLDAPGAAVVWYSPQSGEVLVGAVDFGRAEVGPLAPLAAVSTLTDGGLPACAASPAAAGPVYQFLADLVIPVQVSANSGKKLFTDSGAPSTLLVRATAGRLCVAGVEVRGGGRPLDLSVSFGAKGTAVARSRTSAEDPTKLSIDKLSCLLKDPEPR
jgi:hypothetical protein